jgi:MFS superfamily sulfate permease-like transporter
VNLFLYVKLIFLRFYKIIYLGNCGNKYISKYSVSVVGEIKRGLPLPSLPSLNNVEQLIVPAITIAVVSLSVSISMAKMLSRKHTYKVSSNQVCYANF